MRPGYRKMLTLLTVGVTILTVGLAAPPVLIAPAQAQPFADVPTTHWAYDAIVDLAAKGLIEGYPDGTFKGDRAMTRYEMAMVVARLLAKIESLQIGTPTQPPKPEVTKADLETVQRLVNEFQSELAALGVRVTALEQELNGIKAKLSNVRFTGALRFRYDILRTATGAPVNGNPTTGATDATQSPQLGLAREAFKLSFDGAVTPEVHFIAAMLSNATAPGANFLVFNSGGFGSPSGTILADLDNAFFDWRRAFGLPLEIWLGRFGGTVPGTTYPVIFGPFGLLMNTSGNTWEDTTADSGFNAVDGIYVTGHWEQLAHLNVQAALIRVTGGTGATTYAFGEDAYGFDASVQVIEGLRVGGYHVASNILLPGTPVAGATNADWHVYGPGGGSMNPATANCPATAGGIQCPALGSGGGGYAQWDVTKGIHLDGEFAQWNDAVHGTGDSAYQVNVIWDLGKLLGAGHNLSLQTGYLHYGQNFYPPYGAAEVDSGFQMVSGLMDSTLNDTIYPGNAQAFAGTISFNPTPDWTVYGTFITGNNISNGQGLSEYEAGVQWSFARSAGVTFLVRDLKINGIEQFLLYRAEMNYQF